MPRSSVTLSLLKTALFLSGWAAAGTLWWKWHTAPRTDDFMPATLEQRRADPALDKVFHDFAAQPALQGALLGFCLLDENGKTIYSSPLAETALCPASALKTVTTGAALEVLGPEFRFETTLSGAGSVGPDGVLKGDLVLVGSGDPTLSADDLDGLADQLLKTGLKRVTGRLIADASVFPDNPVSDHWNWGDIGNAYGAGAFGINVDHNRLTASFEPGAAQGAPAKFVGGSLVKAGTKWTSFVLTGPEGSGDQTVIYSQPFGDEVIIRGTMPAGESGFTTGGAIPDPVALAQEILKKRLTDGGVKFGEAAQVKAVGRVTLASHRSEALPEIIDHLHKVSDNLEAQCLFLTLGNQAKEDPAQAVRKHWEGRGLSFTAWRLLDGSGLARANMIRPVDLARVNYATRHGQYGGRFLQSLSIYGNGSISSKLGAMSGVKTEVGFLRCEGGRELTFALMANGLGADVNFWNLKAPFLEQIRKNPPPKL